VQAAAARTCWYVRPLILSHPILVRALRSDPADLLVHAGGGGAAATRTF